jgi:hypothetical protein
MIPFEQLSFEEQAKDVLFVATVRSMASKNGWPIPLP